MTKLGDDAMDEKKWLTSTDPQAMLNWLLQQGKLSGRKARLFTVACCRHIWPLLTDERSQRAVEVAEAFADDPSRGEELTAAYYAANVACLAIEPMDESFYVAASLACQVAYPPFPLHGCSCTPDAGRAVADTVADATKDAIAYRAAKAEELAVQCRLLRDLFNPFRPSTLNPSCLPPSVVALAQHIYDHRSFDRLPELAQSIQDEGCDNAELLAHCHSPGPHTKGCWVVDAVLGKS